MKPICLKRESLNWPAASMGSLLLIMEAILEFPTLPQSWKPFLTNTLVLALKASIFLTITLLSLRTG